MSTRPLKKKKNMRINMNPSSMMISSFVNPSFLNPSFMLVVLAVSDSFAIVSAVRDSSTIKFEIRRGLDLRRKDRQHAAKLATKIAADIANSRSGVEGVGGDGSGDGSGDVKEDEVLSSENTLSEHALSESRTGLNQVGGADVEKNIGDGGMKKGSKYSFLDKHHRDTNYRDKNHRGESSIVSTTRRHTDSIVSTTVVLAVNKWGVDAGTKFEKGTGSVGRGDIVFGEYSIFEKGRGVLFFHHFSLMNHFIFCFH